MVIGVFLGFGVWDLELSTYEFLSPITSQPDSIRGFNAWPRRVGAHRIRRHARQEAVLFFLSFRMAVLDRLTLGCFMVTMIHQLTGGRWGYPTRRFLEAGFMNLPLMLLLFIPIVLGLKFIYPWAEPSQVAQERILQQRHSYQNTWMFIARAVVFFAIAIWMARRASRLVIAAGPDCGCHAHSQSSNFMRTGRRDLFLVGDFHLCGLDYVPREKVVLHHVARSSCSSAKFWWPTPSRSSC